MNSNTQPSNEPAVINKAGQPLFFADESLYESFLESEAENMGAKYRYLPQERYFPVKGPYGVWEVTVSVPRDEFLLNILDSGDADENEDSHIRFRATNDKVFFTFGPGTLNEKKPLLPQMQDYLVKFLYDASPIVYGEAFMSLSELRSRDEFYRSLHFRHMKLEEISIYMDFKMKLPESLEEDLETDSKSYVYSALEKDAASRELTTLFLNTTHTIVLKGFGRKPKLFAKYRAQDYLMVASLGEEIVGQADSIVLNYPPREVCGSCYERIAQEINSHKEEIVPLVKYFRGDTTLFQVLLESCLPRRVRYQIFRKKWHPLAIVALAILIYMRIMLL